MFAFIVSYVIPLIPFFELLLKFLVKKSEKEKKHIQFIISEMKGNINIIENNSKLFDAEEKLKNTERKLAISKRNKQWFQKNSRTFLLILLIASFIFYFSESFLSSTNILNENIQDFDSFIKTSNIFSRALFYSISMSARNFLFINLAICICALITNILIKDLNVLKKILSTIYYWVLIYLNYSILRNAYTENNFTNFHIVLNTENFRSIFSANSITMITLFFLITSTSCLLLINNYFETTKITTDITTSFPLIKTYISIFLTLFLTAWYFTPSTFPFSYLSEYLTQLIQRMK